MLFQRLRIQSLRCLESMDLELDPGINIFVGNNGVGKTSILEAAFLLSHGRSFRSNARDALTRRQAKSMSIFAELAASERVLRLGLGRESGRWHAKVDGESCSLGQLVGQCAVVCFEPGSHALIAGAAEERRRYLDWGVFHVEHSFLGAWRRYHRALKQRNALLREPTRSTASLFEPWELELSTAGEQIDLFRRTYIARLRPHIEASLLRLLPELGEATMLYKRGWPEDTDLLSAYRDGRVRDVGRGHTSLGAHRADWAVSFKGAPLREHLSRGQEKLTALACLLAQATLYREYLNEWPVVCLDDLASELDGGHQAALVDYLREGEAQVLVTGTNIPESLKGANDRVFHVEHGGIPSPSSTS